MIHVQPDPLTLQQRLVERSRIISDTEPNDLPSLETFFANASALGTLLQCTREFLEGDLPELPTEPRIVWLWERGLALPKEVDEGKIDELVRTYAERILSMRKATPAHRLHHALLTLYAALHSQGEDSPSLLENV